MPQRLLCPHTSLAHMAALLQAAPFALAQVFFTGLQVPLLHRSAAFCKLQPPSCSASSGNGSPTARVGTHRNCVTSQYVLALQSPSTVQSTNSAADRERASEPGAALQPMATRASSTALTRTPKPPLTDRRMLWSAEHGCR